MKIRELLLCGAIDPTDPGQDMETPNSLSSPVGPTDVVEPMPQGTSPVSSNPAMNPLQLRQQQMAQQGQGMGQAGMMTPDDIQAMKMAKLYQQPQPQAQQPQPSEQQQQPPDEDEQGGGNPVIPGV